MSKTSLRAMLLGTALVLFAAPAFAQVQITNIIANGSGCPRGSVSALLQGDQASVLFGQYNVMTTQRQTVALSTCNVRIGLRLPVGVSVAITDVTWMGTVALERGSLAQFNRSFTFVGQNVVNVGTRFTQPGPQPFTLNDRVAGIAVSGCRNQTAIVGANTSLALMGIGAGEVQSADIATFSRILLRLSSRNELCN